MEWERAMRSEVKRERRRKGENKQLQSVKGDGKNR